MKVQREASLFIFSVLPNILQVIVNVLQEKFYDAKQDVDSELRLFAADLLDVMEIEDIELKSKQEDLLVLAQQCSIMSVEDFRQQCEGIVQKLEEERQALPAGRLKHLYARMLFILTRCTRLLQYQKESSNG